MNRQLTVYANCSLGGMTSVYRGRALSQPDAKFDFLFLNDRNGMGAFRTLPNCSVRIVRKDQLPNYANFLLSTYEYDEVSITSVPDLPASLVHDRRTEICYEFHTPAARIVDHELTYLDLQAVDVIRTPSDWASSLVRQRLSHRQQQMKVVTVPNTADSKTFRPGGPVASTARRRSGIPVLWIGRFENVQKNYIDFVRVLSLLPDAYYGLMIGSLETDPGRLAQVLAAAGYYGVEDRLDVYLNVAQQDMGGIHRMVASRGGVFCSTSLSETFGFGVLEAGMSGVSVAAYEVGPIKEHAIGRVSYVPVGSIQELARAVRSLSETAQKQ